MRVTRSIMLIIFLHIAIMKRKFYFTRKLILLDTIKAISDSNVMHALSETDTTRTIMTCPFGTAMLHLLFPVYPANQIGELGRAWTL